MPRPMKSSQSSPTFWTFDGHLPLQWTLTTLVHDLRLSHKRHKGDTDILHYSTLWKRSRIAIRRKAIYVRAICVLLGSWIFAADSFLDVSNSVLLTYPGWSWSIRHRRPLWNHLQTITSTERNLKVTHLSGKLIQIHKGHLCSASFEWSSVMVGDLKSV